MQAVVGSAVMVASDVALFAGAGTILTSLGNLVMELYGSRKMAQNLVDGLSGLQQQLDRMLKNGNAKTTNALRQYRELLEKIETALQSHISCSNLERLTKHWSMQKQIENFDVKRAQIQELINLEFMEASTENHASLMDAIESMTPTPELIEELKQMIKEVLTSKAMKREDPKRAKELLIDLKHLIKTQGFDFSPSELEVMKTLFIDGCNMFAIEVEARGVPTWYISRDNVKFDAENPFATGANHNVYHGTLDSGARVAVSIVNADTSDKGVQKKFLEEIEKLDKIHDPHVISFFGANALSKPLMYVTALATNGNYRSFLAKHRNRFWQLFLDAARGLSCLHARKVVHGNLKCNNLLVMTDGTGVISDFMFAFVRTSSVLSVKAKPTKYDWTAPECLGVGPEANPRFASDIYALGLCMIEAITGEDPFAGFAADEEEIRKMSRAGTLPDWSTRYEIPEAVTGLVKEMCTKSYSNRIKLGKLIGKLEVLAYKERLVHEEATCTCATCVCRECARPSGILRPFKPHENEEGTVLPHAP